MIESRYETKVGFSRVELVVLSSVAGVLTKEWMVENVEFVLPGLVV